VLGDVDQLVITDGHALLDLAAPDGAKIIVGRRRRAVRLDIIPIAQIAVYHAHDRVAAASSLRDAALPVPEPTRADLDEPRGHAGENGAAGFAVGWLRCLVDPPKWLF
jgi:hypothetical protein